MPAGRAEEMCKWLMSRLTASAHSTVRNVQVAWSSPHPRASFLGLPSELRLKIYDHVLDFDRDKPEALVPFPDPEKDDWRFKYNSFHLLSDGFETEIQRRYIGQSLPRISWLSLQSTCRTVYHELRSHVLGPEKGQAHDSAHTYALSILGGKGRLQGLHFTSMPCPPQDCRILRARISLRGSGIMPRFWGDGGPMPIVRELYQTLNRFLHCGPRLDAAKSLPHPLKLEKLVVTTYVEEGEDNGLPEEYRARWNERTFDEVYRLLRQLENTGLLQELIEQICVYADDGEGKAPRVIGEIAVRDLQKEGKVPDLWNRYGFQWGHGT